MAINLNRPLRGFRFVQTQVGDTLQKVAARELGDVSQWPSLIYINNLVYPYLTDDETQATEQVILNGGTIMVPSAALLMPLAATADTALGTDIALQNGRLSGDGMGDFAVVSGSDNYEQAVSTKLVTRQGRMLWYPSYGSRLRKLIGSVNGPTAGLLARSYASATILSDQRTVSVGKISVTVQGAAINVSASAVTVNGSVDVDVSA